MLLSITAGGQLGQIDRQLAGLREAQPDPEAWTKAWDEAGTLQVEFAKRDLSRGYRRSASERFLNAVNYYLTGERQTAPGPAKTNSYSLALEAFGKAVETMPRPLERVEINSPDGILPGWLIPARDVVGRAPVVIFYNGFDVTKELLYCIIREEFADRGIACLVVDAPGTGEPLRLRGVASRPDYEVPTSAIVDHLMTRPDLDPERLGLLGISLGGYYAPRGAAFEHRIKACAAWGGVWDYGQLWQHRWETRSKTTPVPFWQLPWVMGTDTMEQALEKVKPFALAEALPHLTQPFLIVHGADDSMIPLSHAEEAIEAAGSSDKKLVVFDGVDGGAEHCSMDDSDPARQLVADWFADRL
ncbi:alpha/beta hydrolase [Nocardia terpenica]|uniref:alpha/beta hydrolase n=1 Tax=Nocardia terpenica TaxID=455432 RepID=UPI001558412B|nr:alpha/beta hydrolase [Nocardia terpenica]NQE85929.1 alpha/beta hydrolase [Nocardia terpenica]